MFRQWRYYKSDRAATVFFRKGTQYECYSVNNSKCHFTGHTVLTLPHDAVPVDLDLSSSDIILHKYCRATQHRRPEPPNSFLMYIGSLEKWEQELIQDVQFQRDVFHFVDMLQQHHTHTTSDGSAPNFIGTFGWVCSLTNGQRIARNNGPAYGHRTNSFRVESYGML